MELTIAAAVSGFAVFFALTALILSFRNHRKNLDKYEICLEQLAETEELLEGSKRQLEQISQQNAEFARRIAWLEARLRQPKTVKEAEIEPAATISSVPQKPTITERRHRVLRLASSGQNPETIAATLGMLAGEVELILNLNRAAA